MPDSDAKTSIYDTVPDERDLWFVPPPPADTDPTAPPWPQAERREVHTAKVWKKAEAGQGRALADTAAAVARLDQALMDAEGTPDWLAAREIAGLSWAEGRRLTPERIALYGVLRLSATAEDHRDLARAEWARARLTSTRDALDPEAFLGRGSGQGKGQDKGLGDGLAAVSDQPIGEEWRALVQQWRDQISAADLHPISRAAYAFHLWRMLGLAPHGTLLEPTLLAARIGATSLHALKFLPMAQAGISGLQKTGTAETRLAGFLRDVTGASRAGLLHLSQRRAWQNRAEAALADLSGRTPGALVAALGAVPVLSAMQAEQMTGASRAAVSRNLALLVRLGLAREITGQSRYRFWKAAL